MIRLCALPGEHKVLVHEASPHQTIRGEPTTVFTFSLSETSSLFQGLHVTHTVKCNAFGRPSLDIKRGDRLAAVVGLEYRDSSGCVRREARFTRL